LSAQLIEVCNEKPHFFPTANQKTAKRAGRFSGESGNPDLSAGGQRELDAKTKKRHHNTSQTAQ